MVSVVKIHSVAATPATYIQDHGTHTASMSSCILSNCFFLCLLDMITTSSGAAVNTAASKTKTITPTTAPATTSLLSSGCEFLFLELPTNTDG